MKSNLSLWVIGSGLAAMVVIASALGFRVLESQKKYQSLELSFRVDEKIIEDQSKLIADLKTRNEELTRSGITPPSSPKEILASIQQIAEIAKGRQEDEMRATAGVLYALAGCLQFGGDKTRLLHQQMIPFIIDLREEIHERQRDPEGDLGNVMRTPFAQWRN